MKISRSLILFFALVPLVDQALADGDAIVCPTTTTTEETTTTTAEETTTTTAEETTTTTAEETTTTSTEETTTTSTEETTTTTAEETTTTSAEVTTTTTAEDTTTTTAEDTTTTSAEETTTTSAEDTTTTTAEDTTTTAAEDTTTTAAEDTTTTAAEDTTTTAAEDTTTTGPEDSTTSPPPTPPPGPAAENSEEEAYPIPRDTCTEIETPGYSDDENYKPNLKMEWFFKSECLRFNVTFVGEFDVRGSPIGVFCNLLGPGDEVSFWQGVQVNGVNTSFYQVYPEACGNTPPAPTTIVNTQTQVFVIKFTSDGTNHGRGFKAKVCNQCVAGY